MKMKFLPGALFGLICFAAGCSVQETKVEEPPQFTPDVDYFTHEVGVQGETLGMIAEWYTGTPANWKKIAGHNPDIVVTSISVGQKVKIPENLVNNKAPLSREIVLKRLEDAKETPAEFWSELEIKELENERAVQVPAGGETETETVIENNVDNNTVARERVSEGDQKLVESRPRREQTTAEALKITSPTSSGVRKSNPSRSKEEVQQLLKSREEYLKELLEE